MRPIASVVGYDDALSRVSELRAMALGPQAAAPMQSAAEAQATAALFQQQLTSTALTDPDEQGGLQPEVAALMNGGAATATTGSATGAATIDPYASMQGAGLSTQAMLLAQLTGQGTASGATGMLGMLPTTLTGAAGVAPVATPASPVAAAAPANVTGKTANLDPELLSRLDRLGAQLGQPIDVISGNRTYEEQAALYQKYLNGTGNLAAPPGSSNHEHGDAVDAYVNGVALADVPRARELAAQLGLGFPVGGESWHVERTDA